MLYLQISEQEKELLLQEQMRKAEEEKVRLEKDWHDISTNLQKEMVWCQVLQC